MHFNVPFPKIFSFFFTWSGKSAQFMEFLWQVKTAKISGLRTSFKSSKILIFSYHYLQTMIKKNKQTDKHFIKIYIFLPVVLEPPIQLKRIFRNHNGIKYSVEISKISISISDH